MIMRASQQLKFGSSDLIEEHLDQTIGGGSIFGWDQNTYDAGSDLVTLRFLFSACDIPYKDLPLIQWIFSTMQAHELGHYILVSSTRLGITLRKISILLDGLVPIVAEKMLTQTGKIWIPLEKYLEQESHSSRIAGLVNAVYILESLRQKLIESWRITHELFALCSSISLETIKKIGLYPYGASEKEAIWTLSVISNPSRIDKVINRISKALGKYPLFESTKIETIDWELLYHTAELIFSENEKKEALDVLNATRTIFSRMMKTNNSKISQDKESVFPDTYHAIANTFARGKSEHQTALTFFQRFANGTKDMSKIMAIINILSNLYAPILPPRKLLQDKECIAKLPKMDQILDSALSRFMPRRVVDIISDTERFADEISWIQQLMGVVTLKDLGNTQISHILGSPEWFEELFNELQLNRRQKNILKGLLAGSQIESDKYLRIISTQGRRTIPRIVQPLFSLLWAIRRLVAPHSSRFDKIYQGLETLSLTNFRSLENVISLYFPLLILPQFTGVHRWSQPTISTCYNSDSLVIAFGANQNSLQVKHAMLRSVLDILRQMLVKPLNGTPIVLCPLGLTKDNSDFCHKQQACCAIKGLIPLFKNGGLIVCCKEEMAKLLRSEGNSKSLQEVGQIKITTHQCIFDSENNNGKNVISEPANKPLSSSSASNKDEENILDLMKKHPIATVLSKGIMSAVDGIATIAVAPLMLVITLQAKIIEKRQRRIEHHTERCLSDMWAIVERLAISAQTKT